MNKAFTRETDDADDEDLALPPVPAGSKNYITPSGYATLRAELLDLIDNERPKVVEIVHWAASNGDRSEVRRSVVRSRCNQPAIGIFEMRITRGLAGESAATSVRIRVPHAPHHRVGDLLARCYTRVGPILAAIHDVVPPGTKIQ